MTSNVLELRKKDIRMGTSFTGVVTGGFVVLSFAIGAAACSAPYLPESSQSTITGTKDKSKSESATKDATTGDKDSRSVGTPPGGAAPGSTEKRGTPAGADAAAACKSKAGNACLDCCDGAFPASDVWSRALHACQCTAATCLRECASSVCSTSGGDVAAESACNDCLLRKTASCESTADEACKAEPSCGARMACMNACPEDPGAASSVSEAPGGAAEGGDGTARGGGSGG